jgi:DNA-binding XRE family transcriptional regulator
LNNAIFSEQLNHMSIHSRIKERRMARKMNRSELAEAVGVSWQSVQLWETEGKTAPKERGYLLSPKRWIARRNILSVGRIAKAQSAMSSKSGSDS